MVFSGIVQEMGEVASMEERDDVKLWNGEISKGTIMTVRMKKGLVGAYEGCSIAINGVCLTVTEFDQKTAKFGLAPETLRRSNLKFLKAGDPVNVEPSLKMTDRNSGHYVQGHVDATGTILKKEKDGDSLRIRVGKVPEELIPFIVEKGYIAVDGTSLTVTAVDTSACWFEFMLIAHTQKAIIVPKKPVGGAVNLEVDIMAKYCLTSVNQTIMALRKEVSWVKKILGVSLLATACVFAFARFKRKQ
mmetsp:Transcript_21610/g.30276  ORF Transcript_21610/g.30276 Transcript_21610/m.30276 type:complete len:246 (+) Transcript_21610:20-757(+)